MKIKRNFIAVLSLLSIVSLLGACGGNANSKEDKISYNNSETSSSTTSSENPYIGEDGIQTPNAIPTEDKEMAFDDANFRPGEAPWSLNITYYSDIWSRGFSFMTAGTVTSTKLYLIEGQYEGEESFANAEEIDCTTVQHGKDSATYGIYQLHQVHVENLKKDQVYSYKIGSEAGWKYGSFKTEVENPKNVSAISLSDAQTKKENQLQYWRNTFKQARIKALEAADNNLDMVLYNGDQFDQNMSYKDGDGKSVDKIYRYAKAIECISDYKTSIPYMPSSGNHEPSQENILDEMNAINFAAYDTTGGYYSYDYGVAHFVVLNTNYKSGYSTKIDVSDDQLNWLKEDLNKTTAKWKVVMMHAGAFATGDHWSTDENTKITEKLTPVFSQYHVDLVLQAHEHTYNKTLPYKWDLETPYLAKGAADSKSTVVNEAPEQKVINEVSYDSNPNGTYYVTTGTAGGRFGEVEADAGVYAEVKKDDQGNWAGLVSNKTYFNAKYQTFNGEIKYASTYKSFTCSNPSYTSAQDYKVGDLASANVNAQMFGILNITEDTLRYDFYTSEYTPATKESQVKLFDSLNVYKGN